MDFPLYTSLSTKLSSRDLTVAQKTYFQKQVESMSESEHELIYALIKAYNIAQENKASLTLPYGGKFVKNDLVFDLEKFPNKLRQLLYKFICLHDQKVEEEKNIPREK